MPTLFCFFAASAPSRLISLTWLDMAIVAIYFVAVLIIGYKLKERASTG
jgi:hypothetical protein